MKDIIHEAWHGVDRLGAESILLNNPEGSFIFRKDEFAGILETQLSEQLHTRVSAFTLSCLEKNHHFAEFTIVCKDHHFQIYDDNPELQGSSYSSIEALLADREVPLLNPILNEAA